MGKSERRQELLDLTKRSTAAQFERTFRSLNPQLIIHQAQLLRPEHECTLYLPNDWTSLQEDKQLYNQINIHVPLDFGDGTKWMVRVRQAHVDRPPKVILDKVTESEVTTTKVLKKGGVKVPDAWMPPLTSKADWDKTTSDKDVADYFFTEFIRGEAWLNHHAPLTEGHISEDVARTLIQGIALLHDTISRIDLKVKGIGSLFPSDSSSTDSYTLGPFISSSTLINPDPPYFLGPFRTNQERYLTHLDLLLGLIYDGVIWTDDPVGAYLWHLEMKDLVQGDEEMGSVEEKCFVKHADDKLSQYMLSKDGHVEGLIDWEWAYVTTKSEAFATPLGLYHSVSFYNGSNTLTVEENLLIQAHETNNRPDLAHCVRNGRRYQRLKDAMRYDRPEGIRLGTINALREAFLGKEAGTGYESLFEWGNVVMDKYREDQKVHDLLKREAMMSK
nr:uncharacterized protein CI109_005218 [Kwoniella shandongensis]KAA5526449.1 hypothetical protein CI109_005218 [Kwoniella shandongensis]